jgi:hypothetical protein
MWSLPDEIVPCQFQRVYAIKIFAIDPQSDTIRTAHHVI